jgi:hypothetical protein
MDLTRLKYIMETHRPLGSFSSLPFAIEEDDEWKVRWFVYDLAGDTTISVKKIITLDRTGRTPIMLTDNMIFYVELSNECKDFNEAEYYQQLQTAFNDHNADALRKLLESAETESSLAIYDAIAKYKEK